MIKSPESQLDDLGLAEEPLAGDERAREPWQVLVVDDDAEVHLITRLALERFRFEDRSLEIISAFSAREARAQLAARPDVALILLDVVMETEQAGLDFAHHVRRELDNALVRIVLRTGQPGQAPPRDIVLNYEIDDYRTKTELTYERLIGVVSTCLRNYRLLQEREQKRRELQTTVQALETSERRAQLIFEGASDGICVTDAELRILDANSAAQRILGIGPAAPRSQTLLACLDPALADLEAWRQRYLRDGHCDSDLPLRRADGGSGTIRFSGKRLEEGFYVGIIRDVTAERAHEDLVQRLSFTDPVTDLPNLAALQCALDEAIDEARRQRQQAGVLLVRLSSFRDINDTLGHAYGNRVLREMGRRLQAALPGRRVARIGGAQFAAVLRNVGGAEGLDRQMQDLAARLDASFSLDGITLSAPAVAGAALYPAHGDDALALIRGADVALGAARRQRRSYLVYEPALDPHTPARLCLMHDLAEALRGDGLALWYQPRLQLATQRIHGVEALLRWTHPVHGAIAPDQFIAAAEHTTLIDELTAWVVREAIAQARRWELAGLPLQIGVNLSVHNLRRAGFADAFAAAYAASGLPPGRILLEVTETAAMEDPSQVLDSLQRLRRQGVDIALDDFGIGQSSLSHLMQLPVSELKLDKSFVQGLDQSVNATIVRSSVKLAHDLGLRVTAEGVEDESALQQLRGMGCDTAQGYWISPALPAAAFERWLAAGRWPMSLPETRPEAPGHAAQKS